MQDRETDEKNPEFHISLTPVKVDGYTQWHVNIKAQRSDSDCAVLGRVDGFDQDEAESKRDE